MELASASADRPQLVIHVGYDKLTGLQDIDNYSLAETGYGTVLTPEGVARIACDAGVYRVVFGPTGQPLDVGRRYRRFPEPMRRAINASDRHCRFPGCDRQPRCCDIDHIVLRPARHHRRRHLQPQP
jgi:hypothetical protein